MYLTFQSSFMKYLPLLTMAFLWMSCSSSKPSHTLENHPDKSLIFGEGGGFAGTVTMYKLFENGQLFRKSPRDNTFSELMAIDKVQADQYFSTVEKMGFMNMKCNEPENWYYFLEMDDDHMTTKLVWGTNSSTATETLKLFYKNLLNVAKKQSAIEKKSVNQ